MTKPNLKAVGDGTFVAAPPRDETPLQRARRRFGRDFVHEQGSRFAYESGATVLTPARVSALREENEKERRKRK